MDEHASAGPSLALAILASLLAEVFVWYGLQLLPGWIRNGWWWPVVAVGAVTGACVWLAWLSVSALRQMRRRR